MKDLIDRYNAIDAMHDLISRQAAIECNGFREVERDDERRSN